jgi:hypothetical protein
MYKRYIFFSEQNYPSNQQTKRIFREKRKGTIPPNHLLNPSAPPNDVTLTEAAKEKRRRSPDDASQ